jgi:hypothetical protein
VDHIVPPTLVFFGTMKLRADGWHSAYAYQVECKKICSKITSIVS